MKPASFFLAIAISLTHINTMNGEPTAKDYCLDDIRRILASMNRTDIAINAGLSCGIDCVFLMLQIEGITCKYSDCENLIPIQENKGCSLYDMQKAASRMGLSTVLVRGSPSRLANSHLPAIVHLDQGNESRLNNHFILVLNISDDDELVYFDPLNSRILQIDRELLSRLSSGHCMVTAPSASARISQLLCYLNLALVASLVLLARFNKSKGSERAGATDHSKLLSEAPGRAVTSTQKLKQLFWIFTVSFFAALGIAGCQQGGTNGPWPSTRRNKGLDPTTNFIDLGCVSDDALAKADFTYRNTDHLPLEVFLREASCTCLECEIQPKRALRPGETGTLSVRLKVQDVREVGPIEAWVWLGTKGTSDKVLFRVIGLREGIRMLQDRLVIRPTQVTSKTIPDVELELFTAARSNLVIKGLHIQEERRGSQTAHQKSATNGGDDANAQSEGPPIRLDIEKMTTSEPVFLPRERCYRRSIAVPVTLLRENDTASGKIRIEYVVGPGQPRSVVVPYLIVAH